MEVMKFKGHPMTEDVMKSVKGGAPFTLYEGNVAKRCPVCDMLVDERSLDSYIVDEETDTIVIRNYICQHCGYVGDIK